MTESHSPSSARTIGAGLRRLALTGLIVTTFSAGVAAERFVPLGGAEAEAQSSFTDLPEFQVLQETWDLIQSDYVAIDQVDNETLMRGAARGMVEALGDTGHSTYLDPEQLQAYESATRGELIGIGVQVEYSTGLPVIVAPIDGSPADEAGLKSQDTIVAIDGRDTSTMTQTEIIQALRGDEGTAVQLTIERESEDDPIVVELFRRKITIEPVSWTMLPGDVALIRLSEFSVGATDGVRDALIQAKEQGATALILDLRDNPGGLVFEAIGVASQFLPEGMPIYRIQERGDEARPVRTTGIGEGVDLPLTVLINSGSASSAEIVASALHVNDRAELIGETTFGTGTVLSAYELSDGSAVLLGVALWLTADGEQIWHQGVEPSVAVELDSGAEVFRPSDDADVTDSEFESGTDNQLRRAYEVVRGA